MRILAFEQFEPTPSIEALRILRTFKLICLRLLALTAFLCSFQCDRVHALESAGPNLIPDKPPSRIYNYFCTWAAQNYLYGRGTETMDVEELFGQPGVRDARALFKESCLNDPQSGWLNYYPAARSDLFFLLDDGYYSGNMNSMMVDTEKFPSGSGKSPTERLRILVEEVKKAGWYGLGIWSRGYPKTEEEAREKVQWSHEAGVGYWKIDTGDNEMNYVRLRDELGPGLILEHSQGRGVLGRRGTLSPLRHQMLRHSDVVRIYDVDQPLSQTTALHRVAEMLVDAQGDSSVTAVINAEDQASIAAGLGCSCGIFRNLSPFHRPGQDPDIYLAGPRHLKKRLDEVARAIRWQRIAPPLRASEGSFFIDQKDLTDMWSFSKGDSWDKALGHVGQAAPARISRGITLPQVNATGNVPYVLACRHPNGVLTVTTLGRIEPASGYTIPLAKVSVNSGVVPSKIGIFGRFESLDLVFDQPLGNIRVLAQDLLADQSKDVSKEVTLRGITLSIPGRLIETIGLSSASPGDESDPGLVLMIVR